MKYLSLITIAAIFLLTACSSNQNKAESLVKDLLQKQLTDPKSYESVSFSKLERLRDTVVTVDGKPQKLSHDGKYEIEHTYRSKNALGGVVTTSGIFHIDSALTQADGGTYIGQRVHKTIN